MLIETVVKAHPILAEVDPDPMVRFPALSATLTERVTAQPVQGRPIEFRIGAFELCADYTDENGVATCGGPFQALLALRNLGYHALFKGDRRYTSSVDVGPVVRVLDKDVP